MTGFSNAQIPGEIRNASTTRVRLRDVVASGMTTIAARGLRINWQNSAAETT
jgi:hypothetical protein